jgi:hypothetical protein
VPKSKVRKKKTGKPQPHWQWIDEPLPEGSFDMELAAILSEQGWVQEDGPGNEYRTYPASPDLPQDRHGDDSQETCIMLDFPRNRDPYMLAPVGHDDREEPYARRYADRAGLLADLGEIETWRASRGPATDRRTGPLCSES